MKIRIIKQPNQKSFGGNVNTHGGDFSTGLTQINNGGTHEDSPYEGVPMGYDNEGTPNLVEEGETIYNDYVYSNRLKVPHYDKPSNGDKFQQFEKILNKYSGKSYSDAAKKAEKDSGVDERPNDSIARRGFETVLEILAESQEQERDIQNYPERAEEIKQYTPEEYQQIKQQQEQEQQQQQAQTQDQEQLMQMLQQAGIDPQQFAQMSPEQQQQIIAQIQQQAQSQQGQDINQIIQQLPPEVQQQLQQMSPEQQQQYIQQLMAQQQQQQSSPEEQQAMAQQAQSQMACGGKLHADGGELSSEDIAMQQQQEGQDTNNTPGTEEAPQQELAEWDLGTPAEEMSTSELNSMVDKLYQYAKEIKDRDLIKRARKARKADRDTKEEFVDDAREDIQMDMEEQQAQQQQMQEQQAQEQQAIEAQQQQEMEQVQADPEQEIQATLPQEQEAQQFAQGGYLNQQQQNEQQLVDDEMAFNVIEQLSQSNNQDNVKLAQYLYNLIITKEGNAQAKQYITTILSNTESANNKAKKFAYGGDTNNPEEIINYVESLGAKDKQFKIADRDVAIKVADGLIKGLGKNGSTPINDIIAILFNIGYESHFNPNAVGDHGKAYGLVQWHPNRRGGTKKLSLDDQIKLIIKEVSNPKSHYYIGGGHDSEEDAINWAIYTYEAPNKVHANHRSYAYKKANRNNAGTNTKVTNQKVNRTSNIETPTEASSITAQYKDDNGKTIYEYTITSGNNKGAKSYFYENGERAYNPNSHKDIEPIIVSNRTQNPTQETNINSNISKDSNQPAQTVYIEQDATIEDNNTSNATERDNIEPSIESIINNTTLDTEQKNTIYTPEQYEYLLQSIVDMTQPDSQKHAPLSKEETAELKRVIKREQAQKEREQIKRERTIKREENRITKSQNRHDKAFEKLLKEKGYTVEQYMDWVKENGLEDYIQNNDVRADFIENFDLDDYNLKKTKLTSDNITKLSDKDKLLLAGQLGLNPYDYYKNNTILSYKLEQDIIKASKGKTVGELQREFGPKDPLRDRTYILDPDSDDMWNVTKGYDFTNPYNPWIDIKKSQEGKTYKKLSEAELKNKQFTDSKGNFNFSLQDGTRKTYKGIEGYESSDDYLLPRYELWKSAVGDNQDLFNDYIRHWDQSGLQNLTINDFLGVSDDEVQAHKNDDFDTWKNWLIKDKIVSRNNKNEEDKSGAKKRNIWFDDVTGEGHAYFAPTNIRNQILYRFEDSPEGKYIDIGNLTHDQIAAAYNVSDPTQRKDRQGNPIEGSQVYTLSKRKGVDYNPLKGYKQNGDEELSPFPEFPTWTNYLKAGILGASTLATALTPIDYSNADGVLKSSKYDPALIGFNPIGDYLTYRPEDINFVNNQLRASSQANARNILNTSAGNRGIAQAGLLANSYNSQIAQGNAYRQAWDSNRAQEQKVAEFNRGTNQYNSEGFLKTDMANQNALNEAARVGVEGSYKSYAMRQALQDQKSKAISQGITGLAAAIDDAAKTEWQRKAWKWAYDRNSNPIRGFGGPLFFNN